MAKFVNPKPAAAEKLPGLAEDPEKGEAKPRETSPVTVPSQPSPMNPQTALSEFTRVTGITDPARLPKGGKKSRKHKKRVHKKTQKRRGKK